MSTQLTSEAEQPPPELMDVIGAFGLSAGNANVVMQLARLPVGHGVARSRVDSGRVDKHPLKRLRTTVSYLAIALLGTESERLAMRREVNRAHRDVHALPDEPVPYDAFDPELQLWVAACLYKGTEDILRLARGSEPAPDRLEALYQYCKRFGTTLQAAAELWPTDREAFARYWETGLEQVAMDELTRSYLQDITQLEYLARRAGPLAGAVRWIGRFFTLGHLPPRFRAELGLPWSERDQRRFERFITGWATINRRLPGPLRRFPVNLYLLDARRRIRAKRPIV
jgi:uncharacterized protein (DUF2236 family)